MLIALLLVGAGCGGDLGTHVNVAPSAESKLDDIMEAVDRLNSEIGEDVYALRIVDSEDRIDGEVIVRVTEELGLNDAHQVRIGNTKKTREGVVVRIDPRATASAIAHELGHAAGLSHVDDRDNLMYFATSSTRWGLSEEQLQHLRALADP
jgi:hypothetical protein